MTSNQRNLKNSIQALATSLYRDESGQALTEYVMLLAMLAGMILTIGTAFRNKIKALMETLVKQSIGQRFFNPRALHTFNL